MLGLYIVPRHANLIISRRKSVIIKEKRIQGIIGTDLVLVTKEEGTGKALGILQLGNPEAISIERFKQIRGAHQITDEERRAWWPGSQKLWMYTISKIYAFKEPIEVKIPQGVQVILRKVDLSKMFEKVNGEATDMVKDVLSRDVTKLRDGVLADYFRKVLAWWSTLKSGKEIKFTENDLLAFGKRIAIEMKKRGFKFHKDKMLKPSLEFMEIISESREFKEFYAAINTGTVSKRGSEILLSDFLKKWDDMKLFENGVQIVGSLANHGKTTGDIDILINADEGSEMFNIIAFRIGRLYPEYAKRIHYMPLKKGGPFTSNVKLCDIVAVKKNELHVNEMSEKVPTFKEDADKSLSEDKVRLFRPFYMPKPMHGRQPEESYTIDTVLRTMDQVWK